VKRSGKFYYRNAYRWKFHMRINFSHSGYGAACGAIGSGYQLTDEVEEVTCKHCLKAMAEQVARSLVCPHDGPLEYREATGRFHCVVCGRATDTDTRVVEEKLSSGLVLRTVKL
jgi:hypothetical protein